MTPEGSAAMEPQALPPGVGRSVARLEDDRLLRGGGRFIADIVLPGQARAVFLRAPHAHARIAAIDTEAARALPGVLAVLTGADVAADGLGGIPWEVRPPTKEAAEAPADALPPLGDPSVAPPQPLMAVDRVRFVGEIVAMAIAETEAQAMDAAEAIAVDYVPLEAYGDVERAVADPADPIHAAFPDNVCFEIRLGDAAATAAAFAHAHHVETLEATQPRLAGVPIETRGYLGDWDAATGRMILHATAGKPHNIRATMADYVFRCPEDAIQVKVGHVGGGFGVKNVLYPEQCLVIWAARRVGRPVRWIGRRDECLASDIAGRDQVARAEMAFDRDGKILAMRARVLGALGAHLAPRGVVPLTMTGRVLSNLYAIPAIDFSMRGVFTNAAPTCSMRGAGQPEGAYLTERLVEAGARALGLDPVEMRRRNLIPSEAMPYATAHGVTYENGDFPALMAAALEAADAGAFAKRRAQSEAAGKLRGLGVANCLEMCGFGYGETATLSVDADGLIDLSIGTQSSGQGHATVYAQLAAARLGLPADRVRVHQGDTERIATGSGTGASRSLTVGGSATLLAVEALVERGRALASALLEAAPDDLRLADGAFEVIGTDRRVTLAEISERAGSDAVPEDQRGPFAAEARFAPEGGSYPNGSHVCEVEIDPETGTATVDRFTIAQDVGRAVNPMIVAGQIHGSVALGIGQAMIERVHYEADSAQLLSGSFMDYAMTRADDLPAIEVALAEVPSGNNLLGAKGVGESGTLAAPAAVVNALLDALWPLGVRNLAMPVTPERIWQAIRDAKAAP